MTPEYWVMEDGEALPKIKMGYGPESTPYYFMTREQADALLEVLGALDFTPTGGNNNALYTELLNAYFPPLLP